MKMITTDHVPVLISTVVIMIALYAMFREVKKLTAFVQALAVASGCTIVENTSPQPQPAKETTPSLPSPSSTNSLPSPPPTTSGPVVARRTVSAPPQNQASPTVQKKSEIEEEEEED
jgi:hypothetical protein